MTLINNAENDKEMKQRFVEAMSVAFDYADIDSKLRLAGTCGEMSDALEERTWSIVAECDTVCAACECGSIVLAGYWDDESDISDNAIMRACYDKNYELVQLMVDLGCSPNRVLEHACQAGNLYLIAGATCMGADDLEAGLQAACLCGEYEAAERMVSIGATDYNRGLWEASYGGRLELVKYMMSLGADNVSGAFDAARIEHHTKVMHYLLDEGAQYSDISD